MINLRGLQYCAKQTAHQDLAGDKTTEYALKTKKKKKVHFFFKWEKKK